MGKSLKVTSAQRAILNGCHTWCDEQDKSTEFMIQYMIDHLTLQGLCKDFDQGHDIVMAYLMEEE